MLNDIIFDTAAFFFIDIPNDNAGQIAGIEAQTVWFVLRFPIPERISIK